MLRTRDIRGQATAASDTKQQELEEERADLQAAGDLLKLRKAESQAAVAEGPINASSVAKLSADQPQGSAGQAHSVA